MKFDQPTTEAILQDLRDEVPYQYAAESNGVTYHGLLRWINKGISDIEEGNESSHYAQFIKAIRQIEKDRIKRHVKNINSDQKGHKGSEWILERAFWRQFSSKAVEIDLNERISKLENKKSEEKNEDQKEATKDGN